MKWKERIVVESKRCYGCMKVKVSSPVCEHCGYDERMSNAPHHLPAGTILQGKYLLGRVLGQGGFGITYLGRDIKLDIPVAIKEYYPNGMVSRESGIDPAVTVVTREEDTRFAENRDRFLREARTLARLQDVPEVVQVMNFFEENNTAYIVMGYVKGITLKEYMRRNGGRLSAEETFRLLEPLMEALGQVHALGLVHRDISPDNIMLQPNRRARLIDFGAAHAATSLGDKSTQAVLKYGFAPPEQYQTKGHLGPWTDVYAMCATIYHCITGLQPPNITDLLMGEADFAWDSLTGLTPGQLAALKRGLSLQIKQRIQSMEELCRQLFGGEEAPIPQPKPAHKPQPSVSETGTVALVGSGKTHSRTAPPRNPQPAQKGPFTAPVNRENTPVRKVTTPVEHKTMEENEKPHRRKGMTSTLIAVAVLLAIVLLVFVFGLNKNDDTVRVHPTDTQPMESRPEATYRVTEPSQVATDGNRVLMVHTDTRKRAFRTGFRREQIRSITILNTTEFPENALDASRDWDGSVVAWVTPNDDLYDLYLAANGIIVAPEDCTNMFRSFTNLEKLDLSGLDTGNVIYMAGMFSGCSSLTELNISGMDTGNVKVMRSMFERCSNLEQLDISGMDTVNVTDMSSMFYGCSSLTELNISGMDTGNVTDMSSMFEGCSNLEQLDISGMDTVNVTDMSNMFSGCSSLTELNISGMDTGNVKVMRSMFERCSNLEQLDISGMDTVNVTDMSSMFESCSSLTQLDISTLDTSNVTDMGQMFYGTSKLGNVNGNFDVKNVDSHYLFMDSGDTFNGSPWKELFQ